jgi:hypothetical protein
MAQSPCLDAVGGDARLHGFGDSTRAWASLEAPVARAPKDPREGDRAKTTYLAGHAIIGAGEKAVTDAAVTVDAGRITCAGPRQGVGPDPGEAVRLGDHTTEGMNIAIGGQRWRPGDEVLASAIEHIGGRAPLDASSCGTRSRRWSGVEPGMVG